MENKRYKTELADILIKHKEVYCQNHSLCPEQSKAFEAIIKCRTTDLGGHIKYCNHCGYKEQAYNSCRNRHCPKCQFIKQAQWVDKLKANLIPVRYFHLVFTIPRCLHKTFYINQRIAYDLLFKAAAQALGICAKNPKYLGAQSGAVAVLHTWGQTLSYHPHIHMLVPAGGLSDDGMEWIHSEKKFFLPIKVLSALFRGILVNKLSKAIVKSRIRLAHDISDIKHFKKLMYTKPWVVYAKKPMAGPQRVIEYLGRYTHRVAITNHRIIEEKDGTVTFRYKDYRTGRYHKKLSLQAIDFIQRFLMHVLPCGFYKIRYFGILASRNATSKRQICFNLIETDCYLPMLEGLCTHEVYSFVCGKNLVICPICKKGKLIQLPVKTQNLNRAG